MFERERDDDNIWDHISRLYAAVSELQSKCDYLLQRSQGRRSSGQQMPPMPPGPYGSGGNIPAPPPAAYTSESWREQMQQMANPMTSSVVESTYPDAGRLGGTAIGVLCVRPGTDLQWARRRGLDPSRRSIVVSIIDNDQGTHMPIVLDVEDAKQLVNRLAEAITVGDDEGAKRNWPWPGSGQ